MKKILLNKSYIIVLIVLLIIIMTFLVSVIVNNKKDKLDESPFGPRTDRYLKLSGFGVFFEEYNGDFTATDITKHIEETTTEYLPKLYKETKRLNDNKLEEYYNDKKKAIKEYLGITKFNDFLGFIHKLKQSNINVETWDRLDVLKETFVDKSELSGYAYVEYFIEYKNEKKIKYSLYVSHSEKKLPNYIINILD